jgi:hypothetical protein
MRLPTKKHRLERQFSALVCVAIVWLCACGCQGPQLDRLDGSPSLFALGQDPVVDNGPPSSRAPARDASTLPAVDAIAQSNLTGKATIGERLNRGHRETALKNYEQAEICYRGVLELDPDNPIANHRLAVLADRRGDFATSEKCYLIALKREPNDPDLLSDLGYSYLLQGRPIESERCLLAALRANPLHQKARDNLGLLYAGQGDRERAFEMVKRSVGEAEARSRLAQFFPPAHPAVREDDTVTASFAPASTPDVAVHDGSSQPEIRSTESAAPPGPAQSSPPSSGGVDVAGAPGPSPLEKHLADLMEKERQRATEERTQRESVGLPIAPPAQAAAAGESLTTSISTEPSRQPTPQMQPESAAPADRSARDPTVPAVPTGRVPDDRINDAFAAIDREASDNSGTTAPAADQPPASPAAPTPWRSSAGGSTAGGSIAGESKSSFGPQQQANPLTSMPLWPGQSSPRPTAALQAAAPQTAAFQAAAPRTATIPTSPSPATPSEETGTTSAPRENSGRAADAGTPSPPKDLDDWESVRKSAQDGPIARPLNDISITPSSATSSVPAPQATSDSSPRIGQDRDWSDRPATPSGTGATRPETADSKDGWDRDAETSTPPWPSGNDVPLGDRSSFDTGKRVNAAFDSQPASSPRIVPTGILPTAGNSERPVGRRVPDELDEFEAQIKKNGSKISSGRSSSNSGAATKPAAPGDPSTSGRDPWPLHIEPRHNPPPPLFAPDDPPVQDKKSPVDKQNSFDSGSNWSDVPVWQGAPAAGSSSTDRESGPAIRPGSF